MLSNKRPKIHFIAVGGSAMHNLALALQENGYIVSGSDDEIFEPSFTRLKDNGILPPEMGWYPEKIDSSLDAIILGMHAKEDNPELIKAKELGLKVYSYPDFVFENSKQKHRIVIAGSHGKTTITSMILHVLKNLGVQFDYLVGAKLDGFDKMVKLSDAPLIVIEGDEYLDSPITRRSKFLVYQHHLVVISGISWDHINVFPTQESYELQFKKLIDATPKAGVIIYNSTDKKLKKLCDFEREDIRLIPYEAHPSTIKNGLTSLKTTTGNVDIQVFGEHNILNLSAAKAVCDKLGIDSTSFYRAIRSFKGAAGRLQVLAQNSNTVVYKDFAHAPSKLLATTQSVAKQFPKRKLLACLELHTFSSLNKKFIQEYAHTFDAADEAIVFVSAHTIEAKKMEMITEAEIWKAFDNKKIKLFTDSKALETYILAQNWENKNLLLMSSGNFSGLPLEQIAKKITA